MQEAMGRRPKENGKSKRTRTNPRLSSSFSFRNAAKLCCPDLPWGKMVVNKKKGDKAAGDLSDGRQSGGRKMMGNKMLGTRWWETKRREKRWWWKTKRWETKRWETKWWETRWWETRCCWETKRETTRWWETTRWETRRWETKRRGQVDGRQSGGRQSDGRQSGERQSDGRQIGERKSDGRQNGGAPKVKFMPWNWEAQATGKANERAIAREQRIFSSNVQSGRVCDPNACMPRQLLTTSSCSTLHQNGKLCSRPANKLRPYLAGCSFTLLWALLKSRLKTTRSCVWRWHAVETRLLDVFCDTAQAVYMWHGAVTNEPWSSAWATTRRWSLFPQATLRLVERHAWMPTAALPVSTLPLRFPLCVLEEQLTVRVAWLPLRPAGSVCLLAHSARPQSAPRPTRKATPRQHRC